MWLCFIVITAEITACVLLAAKRLQICLKLCTCVCLCVCVSACICVIIRKCWCRANPYSKFLDSSKDKYPVRCWPGLEASKLNLTSCGYIYCTHMYKCMPVPIRVCVFPVFIINFWINFFFYCSNLMPLETIIYWLRKWAHFCASDFGEWACSSQPITVYRVLGQTIG